MSNSTGRGNGNQPDGSSVPPTTTKRTYGGKAKVAGLAALLLSGGAAALGGAGLGSTNRTSSRAPTQSPMLSPSRAPTRSPVFTPSQTPTQSPQDPNGKSYGYLDNRRLRAKKRKTHAPTNSMVPTTSTFTPSAAPTVDYLARGKNAAASLRGAFFDQAEIDDINIVDPHSGTEFDNQNDAVFNSPATQELIFNPVAKRPFIFFMDDFSLSANPAQIAFYADAYQDIIVPLAKQFGGGQTALHGIGSELVYESGETVSDANELSLIYWAVQVWRNDAYFAKVYGYLDKKYAETKDVKYKEQMDLLTWTRGNVGNFLPEPGTGSLPATQLLSPPVFMVMNKFVPAEDQLIAKYGTIPKTIAALKKQKTVTIGASQLQAKDIIWYLTSTSEYEASSPLPGYLTRLGVTSYAHDKPKYDASIQADIFNNNACLKLLRAYAQASEKLAPTTGRKLHAVHKKDSAAKRKKIRHKKRKGAGYRGSRNKRG
ncbi:MAG TPA: hypothetical protein VLG38_03575 [Gammaproteobacteria bacterium]|nr:hypothetical protein [Gammaproteobacteria bacterium]